MPRRCALLITVGMVAGCNLSPLQNRIDVGRDAFVAFVGVGSDGNTDIYAGIPAGGELSRITFTPVDESHPVLTPMGDMIAFVRYPPPSAMAIPRLVVMNLLNGAERDVETLLTAGPIDGLAWNDDQTALWLRSAGVTWQLAVLPPDRDPLRLEGPARAVADSAIDVVLGTPGFARAMPCDGGGVCVVGPAGTPTVLTRTGRDAFRWGGDSVAWFEDDQIVVRPLGAGAPRLISWRDMPRQMRQGSYAVGGTTIDVRR